MRRLKLEHHTNRLPVVDLDTGERFDVLISRGTTLEMFPDGSGYIHFDGENEDNAYEEIDADPLASEYYWSYRNRLDEEFGASYKEVNND